MNKILVGDCLIKLKELEDNSVDSIVTDPPYGLGFMGKEWDTFDKSQFGKKGEEGANDLKVKKNFNILPRYNTDGLYEFSRDWAKECLRVLKPGGYILAFAGTRTYHKITMGIEDAGFEVRDMIEWVYSTGFPKSLNVWKQLKKNCTCGNMEAYEKRAEQNTKSPVRPLPATDLPQTLTDKKAEWEVLQSGLSEQGVPTTILQFSDKVREGQSSVEGGSNTKKTERKLQGGDLSKMSKGVSTDGEERRLHNATQISDGPTPEPTTDENGSGTPHRPQSEQQQDREPCAFCKQYGTQAIRTFGVGTALKPAHEPICMARKPLSEKTVAENCLKWGTGGINIDESRVGGEKRSPGFTESIGNKQADNAWNNGMKNKNNDTSLGRFPANLIHDNSEEVRELFPETKSGALKPYKENHQNASSYKFEREKTFEQDANSGNASRFFKSILYVPKASKSERNKGCEGLEDKFRAGLTGADRDTDEPLDDVSERFRTQPAKNNHPTVKPVALMEYLIKMVTPKGGIVLDPFAGSGSTLVAAKQNGFQYIGIEMTEEYIPIIEARLNAPTNTLF